MKRIIPIILILALAGGAWWWFQQPAPSKAGLTASGTIEARQVRLAAEVGGRIVELSAQEGQTVTAGQVMLRLDDSLVQAQHAQAQAAVDAAQAQRAVLAAGARPEQLEAAQAAISVTQASLAGAQAELNRLLVGASSADRATAQAALVQAQAQLKAAEANQKQVNEAHNKTMECQDVTLPNGETKTVCPLLGTQEELARSQLGAADQALQAAQAAEQAARSRLAKVYGGATVDEINALQARVAASQAQVRQAEAQYKLLQAGASKEQLAAADAAVAQAQAALKVLETQADKLVVRSPITGLVIARNVEPGEILAPSAAAFVLGQLDTLELVVYLPEDRYGQVKLGQMAQVTVDSYPGEIFTGTVAYIASQAEFTPRNVQTAEGRRTMVFAVKLSLPNPAGKLKPGMPADVKFD